MFGHRSDGKEIKTLPPIFKLIPCIMPERSDAHVYFKQDINLKYLDEYIDKKAEEGIKLSYMYVIYAAVIRILSERPELNRFIMNGRVYARNGIHVSLAVKKNLTDEGEETTTKLEFTGKENIFEVKERLDKLIEENKNVNNKNETDNLAKALSIMPTTLVKYVVKFLWFLDKHGMLPKSVINASPFHTSVFITNVGSLGIDTIYHHIYNFGTTSLFFSMGKKKKSYIYEDDEIQVQKCITVGFVGDERICDGFYFANSFKQLQKYLRKPELLETPGEPKVDIR